jgi:hypothetical protein
MQPDTPPLPRRVIGKYIVGRVSGNAALTTPAPRAVCRTAAPARVRRHGAPRNHRPIKLQGLGPDPCEHTLMCLELHGQPRAYSLSKEWRICNK